MEREAASSKEIWKETGWMRGPDHKWRFEIPDSLDKINFRKDVKPHTLGEIIELGNVEYVNKKKTTQWYASEEVNSSIPEELMSSLFNQNIPNENDLVKLKKKHPDLYQMTGERAKTAMISRLQKAESMEREAASSKEIWKETGWMRGPDHKWRFEIPDNLDKINFPKDSELHTLGEIYDNPVLYEVYPELAQETVRMEDTKTVEILSKGNAAVKKSARDSALILSKMAENFHKNYGVPLKMAAVKINSENARIKGDAQMTGENVKTAEDKLADDKKAFAESIDKFQKGKIKEPLVRVMTTPLAMNLVNAPILPVYIRAKALNKILNGKHAYRLDTDILRQIPRALTDPVAIYSSDTQPGAGQDGSGA